MASVVTGGSSVGREARSGVFSDVVGTMATVSPNRGGSLAIEPTDLRACRASACSSWSSSDRTQRYRERNPRRWPPVPKSGDLAVVDVPDNASFIPMAVDAERHWPLAVTLVARERPLHFRLPRRNGPAGSRPGSQGGSQASGHRQIPGDCSDSNWSVLPGLLLRQRTSMHGPAPLCTQEVVGSNPIVSTVHMISHRGSDIMGT